MWQTIHIAQVRAQKSSESDKQTDADLSRRAALALGASVTLSGAFPFGNASASSQPASLSPSSALTDTVPSIVRQAVPLATTAEGALSACANDTVPVGRSGAPSTFPDSVPAVCHVIIMMSLCTNYELLTYLGLNSINLHASIVVE